MAVKTPEQRKAIVDHFLKHKDDKEYFPVQCSKGFSIAKMADNSIDTMGFHANKGTIARILDEEGEKKIVKGKSCNSEKVNGFSTDDYLWEWFLSSL